MQDFRLFLQHEFARRMDKNPSYSLRAFANHLKINHATLSTLLSGKRPLTAKTAEKLGLALNFSPTQVQNMIMARGSRGDVRTEYTVLQQDTFASMSEWYFDAILEMTLIPHFRIEPSVIAAALGITSQQATLALETLERLNLISKIKKGKYKLLNLNSDNCLGADYTSAANRKYQLSILKKSIESLEEVDRIKRDHTSMTVAVDTKDLPKIKEMIQKFRRDVDAYTHRSEAHLNEVYQLQVSFFPLTNKEDMWEAHSGKINTIYVNSQMTEAQIPEKKLTYQLTILDGYLFVTHAKAQIDKGTMSATTEYMKSGDNYWPSRIKFQFNSLDKDHIHYDIQIEECEAQ